MHERHHDFAPLAALLLLGAAPAQTLFETQAVDTAPVPVIPSAPTGAFAAGDLDGDGDDDLAAIDNSESVIYRRQAGGWTRQVLLPGGSGKHAAIADFDGDGFQDVLLGSVGSLNNQLRIWWGDGTGQFAAAPTTVPYLSDFADSNLVHADVDHDGDVDFVLGKRVGPQLHSTILLRNLGSRTFAEAPQSQFPLLNSGNCTAFFVDVDGDTFLDVLTVSRNNRSRLLWNNNGNFAEATTAQFPLLQGSYMGLGAGDFDGDGDVDLAYGGDTGAGILVRTIGPRQLALAPTGLPGANRTVHVHAGDVDGDGDLDLQLFRRERGQLWQNDGTGQFTRTAEFGSCDEPVYFAAADLDDDGDKDLLRSCFLPGQLDRGRLAASCTVRAGLLEHLGDGRLPMATGGLMDAIGDIDGDGLLDLSLLANEPLGSNPNGTMQFARNDGRGVFVHRWSARAAGTGQGFLADITGDGRAEYVAFGTTASYFLNTQGELALTALPLPVTQQTLGGIAADLDGDGDNELLLLVIPSAGTSGMLVYGWNGTTWQNETTARNLATPLPSPATLLSLHAADLDGDLDLDLWLRTSSNGRIYRNNGAGVFQEIAGAIVPPPFSSAGSVGDFDGDGDLDLQHGDRWYRNSGNATFPTIGGSLPSSFSSSERIWAVDLDDDGDVDLLGDTFAAWNNGTGTFTTANNLLPQSFVRSLACFDWDRDGDPDLVARQSFDNKPLVFANQTRHLRLAGPARLGGALDFRFRARPGGTPTGLAVWVAASFARIPPTPAPGLGWLMIDPAQAVPLGPIVLPAQGGDGTWLETVPNQPSLLGIYLCAQPVELRGSRLRLGNLVETYLGR